MRVLPGSLRSRCAGCWPGPPVRSAGTEQLTVADASEARRILADRGDAVLDFEFRHGRMDDVFLALTGHGVDAGGAR